MPNWFNAALVLLSVRTFACCSDFVSAPQLFRGSPRQPIRRLPDKPARCDRGKALQLKLLVPPFALQRCQTLKLLQASDSRQTGCSESKRKACLLICQSTDGRSQRILDKLNRLALSIAGVFRNLLLEKLVEIPPSSSTQQARAARLARLFSSIETETAISSPR